MSNTMVSLGVRPAKGYSLMFGRTRSGFFSIANPDGSFGELALRELASPDRQVIFTEITQKIENRDEKTIRVFKEALTDSLRAIQKKNSNGKEILKDNLTQPRRHATADTEVDSNVQFLVEHVLASCESEARQINDALQRIEQGSFGECQGCGETIPAQRLLAKPCAALCRECAAAEEESR